MKKLLLYISVLFLFSNSYIYAKSAISMEEKITALYVAYFQRAADYGGLTYWNTQADGATTDEEELTILKEISARFSTQAIFIETYSKLDNQKFVEEIYQNILGSSGDKGGVNYWTSLLDSGVSRSDMVATLINVTMNVSVSLENFPTLSQEEINNALSRQNTLFNRVAVALYFTSSFKELSDIKAQTEIEKDPAYIASQKVLLSLYSNPFDKTVGINFIDNAIREDDPIAFITNDDFITISGVINYERPLLNSNHIGLSTSSKVTKPAPRITVKLIDKKGDLLSTTSTNEEGEYHFFYLPKNSEVKVRAYALLTQNSSEESDGGDIKVVDNTHNDAIYTVDGRLRSTKESDNIRNLTIPLQSKASAPFSILNDIYLSMKKILDFKSTQFPSLTINWSIQNTSSQGSLEDGQIGTSFFDGQNSIYLLGDPNGDNDEYDTSVIVHEWSHYFEQHFSRADTIGGEHGEGERLDIRVAFSEGFGNAWSAIATDDPIYSDTAGVRGWFMNIEHDATVDAGWWAEGSVQKILYDLYDGANEPHDKIALGVKPIYDVLTTSQKETKAFTSLFSFITLLKEKDMSISNQIDSLLSHESIESISDDIYGEKHHNLYVNLGEEICTSSQYGEGNKLFNHKYVRFTIENQKSYTLRVKQNNGNRSDPDILIYSVSPFKFKKEISSPQNGVESSMVFLSQGEYLLDISDYNNLVEACFDVTIE